MSAQVNAAAAWAHSDAVRVVLMPAVPSVCHWVECGQHDWQWRLVQPCDTGHAPADAVCCLLRWLVRLPPPHNAKLDFLAKQVSKPRYAWDHQAWSSKGGLPDTLAKLGRPETRRKADLDSALLTKTGALYSEGAWSMRSVCTIAAGDGCYAPVEVQPAFGTRRTGSLTYVDTRPPQDSQRNVLDEYTQFRLNPAATYQSRLRVGGVV